MDLPSYSHRPTARALAVALSSVLAWSLLVVGAVTLGAKPVPQVSFVDYAQCADGTANDAATDCPGSWINGILQASNSTYHEDEVTPQRAELLVPAGAAAGNHSFTFRYMARKGSAGVHAYDSLATWNYTQSTADRNQGLNAADVVGGAATTFAIPSDSQVLAPCTVANCATSDHQLAQANRQFTMYGGTIDSVDPIVHDCVATNKCADASVDDYASITIHFHVASVPSKVQLLFGGHLAAGAGARSWGTSLGASSINGGPYHIKWDLADGASVGNRDNQIMGSAILSFSTALVTSPNPATHEVSSSTYLNDSATLSLGTNPGGSILFKLFPPSDATCSGAASYSETVTVNGNGTYSTNNTTVAATIVGVWHWTADYSGDGANQPSSSGCSAELVTITQAQPAVSTSATASITIGGTISDTATISGLVLPDGTGTITFELYGPDDATCSGTNLVANVAAYTVGPVNANGPYSSPAFTPSAVGTYRWIANFSGDANNAATSNTCNGANEASVVGPATPSAGTTPDVQIRDNVTLTGGYGTITGNVDFALYDNDQCSGTAVFSQDNVALVNASAQSDWTDISASDTYYWQVHYDGDGGANAAFTSACGEATVITLPS